MVYDVHVLHAAGNGVERLDQLCDAPLQDGVVVPRDKKRYIVRRHLPDDERYDGAHV